MRPPTQRLLLAVALTLTAACGPTMQVARTSTAPPPMPREVTAAANIDRASCDLGWGYLFPGLAQLCLHRTADGATLAALATAEATLMVTALADDDIELDHPAAFLPVVGLQNLYVIGVADPLLELQRALRLPYTPQDNLGELALAPFNWEVMSKPSVWGGILATTGTALAVVAIQDRRAFERNRAGRDANLFGRTVSPLGAYPAAGTISAGLMAHVAIGEEMLFRGLVQSGLTRRWGENHGWWTSSAIFGAFHLLNLPFIPPSERRDYATISVPLITLIGGYLGHLYRDHGYSLAPPVAHHFWHNFMVSMAAFALDPANSPLSASIAIPF